MTYIPLNGGVAWQVDDPWYYQDADECRTNFADHETRIVALEAVSPGGSPSGDAATTRSVGITIDGGGAEITTGVKGFIEVPFAGTITGVTLLSTDASVTSGSIVIDVWNDTYANYPPTDADSITASAPPTISGATKGQDTTLTGWDTAIAAGDILGFNVDSVTDLTRVTLIVTIEAA